MQIKRWNGPHLTPLTDLSSEFVSGVPLLMAPRTVPTKHHLVATTTEDFLTSRKLTVTDASCLPSTSTWTGIAPEVLPKRRGLIGRVSTLPRGRRWSSGV